MCMTMQVDPIVDRLVRALETENFKSSSIIYQFVKAQIDYAVDGRVLWTPALKEFWTVALFMMGHAAYNFLRGPPNGTAAQHELHVRH
mmetsp:Transcript_30310/g.48978  ORF Transcript_30310/g.48978 Transcript_30310/m.48978 type:complete len:88 (+) Transcript_30310:122-385(+)